MSDKVEVAVLEDYGFLAKHVAAWQMLNNRFNVSFYENTPDIATLKRFNILVGIRERISFTSELMVELDQLSHIALTGRVGAQINLDFAKARRIDVSFTSGSLQAPVELTMALMLALNKNIVANHESMQKDRWHTQLVGELKGRTLGIVGLGRLGQQVALLGKALGMRVIASGKDGPHAFAETNNIERVTLMELFRRSYVVSVHLKLNAGTKEMIRAEHLDQLKDGAIFINTARAGVVNNDDLIKCAKRGAVKFGLDVFDKEPLSGASLSLKGLPNVLLSPHMGYMSEEIYTNFFTQVVDNLNNWLDGKPYKSAIAP